MQRAAFVIAIALLLSAAPRASEAPPVTIADVARQPIVRSIRISGTVTSPRSARLSAAVPGLVAAMKVDAGDTVEQGDLLVVLDAELESLELARREAELAQARTTLADARRRLDEAERVASASAIAETEIKSRRAGAESSAAAVEAAEAAVRQQRAIVARHEVSAPFGGVVSDRLAELGEWVNPGDELLEVVATDGLRFDFRVPQEYHDDLDVDTPVRLESDAVPDFSAEGRIQAIVPVKDPGARTFLVRVVSANEQRAITPGMSARGEFRIDERRDGLVVSRDALLRYPDGREVVWIVDRDAELPTVSERQVETGLMFDGQVEIVAGLEPGESVVTRGNEALQEGQTVRIQD